MSDHEPLTINAGMCGGCEVCGTREEQLGCTGCDWLANPMDDPQTEWDRHQLEVSLIPPADRRPPFRVADPFGPAPLRDESDVF